MAYFAKLDEENVVTTVIVIGNANLLDADGNEVEQLGVDRCVQLRGEGNYKQTSYNTQAGVHPEGRPFRKNYCGPGFIYHPPPIDGFSPPQPFPSWTLNKETCQWTPPVPMPEREDNEFYVWNEDEQKWDLVEP